jgi:hypothetical protein
MAQCHPIELVTDKKVKAVFGRLTQFLFNAE